MAQNNAVRDALPYNYLTDFEISEEARNPATLIRDRLKNHGFRDFISKHIAENQEAHYDAGFDLFDYSDTEQFNIRFKDSLVPFSLIHINCRRIAANKGKILALIMTLELEFDVIALSEIGDDAENYINDQFLPNYESHLNPPVGTEELQY